MAYFNSIDQGCDINLIPSYSYLNEIVVIKIDFEKAFDKVEYSVILSMLARLGFGEKFIAWIKSILQSTSTSFLLNGVHGKIIHCLRGMRQGDPLSPLLLFIASELLQYIINDA
jgi:hypothetical protein